MDTINVDSDSERWEDFFGSSTDLTPSMIGYYDRLSTEISKSDQELLSSGPVLPSIPKKPINICNNRSFNTINKLKPNFDGINSTKLIANSNDECVSNTTTNGDGFCDIWTRSRSKTKSPPPSQGDGSSKEEARKPHKLLSPTVARLVAAHSNDKDFKFANPKLNGSFRKPPTHLGKVAKTNTQLPLSKNTCKLSAQSGNDLVIDKIGEDTGEPVEEPKQTKVSCSTPIQQFHLDEERNTAKIQIDSLLSSNDKASSHEDDLSEIEDLNLDDLKEVFRVSSGSDAGKMNNNQDQTRYSQEFTTPSSQSRESHNNKSKTDIITLKTLMGSPKFNHRPLSVSSICSTSSSSSSNSDMAKSLQRTNYLASVESLADQSENETLSSGSNKKIFTVLERATNEIVDSERIYVDDLKQVISGYLNDWRERACLKVDELDILFSNITEVYQFSLELLQHLVEAQDNIQRIAKCFLYFRDKFDVYTVYCTSYPEAISLLTSLLQATHTNNLLTSTQKKLQHTLPLGSYLLKPVQRILKYHLLLDNLRKHCDVPEVVEAYEIMRKVAGNIDQMKKNLEQKSRVKQLSGILDGWLGPELTVLGDLRQEGTLIEHNKPREVFLFETMLIITKPKEDKRLQFKTYIHRKDIMLVEHIPGEPTSFNVIPFNDPRHQIKLTARNRDQKRLWAQQIKSLMLEDFNVPNRAKELVYKLGYEEDRTPDKGTRKWTQSSTPEYLERRNQYRRSEMRYRSKKAKKNITSSASMECFDNKDGRSSFLNKSGDLETAKSEMHICGNCDENCKCGQVKSEFREIVSRKNEINQPRSRSKSESRLSKSFSQIDRQREQPEQACNDLEGEDVKIYTSKLMPKRIVTLKKNRAKSITSSSTFYRDLNDVSDKELTELRITESKDNISTNNSDNKHQLDCNNSTTSKNDSEIISELLKNNKDFQKILKKPPRKRSIDRSLERSFSDSNGSTPNGSICNDSLLSVPPEKLSSEATTMQIMDRLNSIEKEIGNPEPIYESLLRNVHVPYKSPIGLNRSVSQQYPKTPIMKSKNNHEKTKRPESDYVTLIYDEVGHENDTGSSATGPEVMILRSSDSNINYGKPTEKSEINKDSSKDHSNAVNECGSSSSLPMSIKNCSSLYSSMRSIKTVDKNNSFSSERSFLYKQGSENLGSRIAHIDYVDPKTLFNIPKSGNDSNILVNTNAVKAQRDSVFSLTSSNDSVDESKPQDSFIKTTEAKNNSQVFFDEFYYENNVEELLENDNFFRDSAVYSDDNDRKIDEQIYSKVDSIIVKRQYSGPSSPPPIPVKPKHLVANQHKRLLELKSQKTENIVSQKSWVQRQVTHFEK